jgi:hypothetical protein
VVGNGGHFINTLFCRNLLLYQVNSLDIILLMHWVLLFSSQLNNF